MIKEEKEFPQMKVDGRNAPEYIALQRELMKRGLKEQFENYLKQKRILLQDYIGYEMTYQMEISEMNYITRNIDLKRVEKRPKPRVGEICFFEFGEGYDREVGFQHLAIVLSVSDRKCFVIPMTSNYEQYSAAYDPQTNPKGKRNLMRIDGTKNLRKHSVLFLNDGKYINSMRLLNTIERIDPNSEQFKLIQERVKKLLFN